MVNLSQILFLLGENFPSSGGELKFRVVWGKEEAFVEPLCSSKSIEIHQEVAFQIYKNDKRLQRNDTLCLDCKYIDPAGSCIDFGKVKLQFDSNVELIKKVHFH